MGNKQTSSETATFSGNRNNLSPRNNQSLYSKTPLPINREKPVINRRCSELKTSPNLTNGSNVSAISSNASIITSFDTASTSGNKKIYGYNYFVIFLFYPFLYNLKML